MSSNSLKLCQKVHKLSCLRRLKLISISNLNVSTASTIATHTNSNKTTHTEVKKYNTRAKKRHFSTLHTSSQTPKLRSHTLIHLSKVSTTATLDSNRANTNAHTITGNIHGDIVLFGLAPKPTLLGVPTYSQHKRFASSPSAKPVNPKTARSSSPNSARFTAAVVAEDDADALSPNAGVTFELIFNEISQSMGGDEHMVFPKDIMWLSGAPGAGKGEMSLFIQNYRDYQTTPIRISNLITGPEVEKLKADGVLVSDRLVVRLLLEKLLKSEYKSGVIVDGFPRTKLQAESIKLLFDKMLWLRRKFEGTPFYSDFRRPKFHVTVLYVGRQVSIDRQLLRGKKLQSDNERVIETGVGELQPIRETDLDANKARQRYKWFIDHIYSSLQVIKEKFPFHFVNAEANVELVKQRIATELEFQSTAELADETYELIRQLPLAAEIKKEARQKLVLRLDSYLQGSAEQKEIFLLMIHFFKTEFEPIIRQQALAGNAVINTENVIFKQHPSSLTMLLDIMAERGYKTIVDFVKEQHRIQKIDMQTGNVLEWEQRRIYKFQISFPSPNIRSAVSSYEGAEQSVV